MCRVDLLSCFLCCVLFPQWLMDLHSKVQLQTDEPLPVMLLANKVHVCSARRCDACISCDVDATMAVFRSDDSIKFHSNFSPLSHPCARDIANIRLGETRCHAFSWKWMLIYPVTHWKECNIRRLCQISPQCMSKSKINGDASGNNHLEHYLPQIWHAPLTHVFT